jgi:transcription antitermination protein NusB
MAATSVESEVTDTPPAKRGSSRTKARKRALDILFEADLRETSPTEALAAHLAENQPPVRDFTVELVEGVATNIDQLDELIVANLATGWTLSRMPRVDRNLARLAIFELLHTTTATDVVMAEAVSLCQELSTDESPAFLNGLLGAIATRQSALS